MPIKSSASLVSWTPIDAGFYPRVKSAGPPCYDCQSSFPGGTESSNKAHPGTLDMSLQCKLGNSQMIEADRPHGMISDPLVLGLDVVTFFLHATRAA